VERGAALRADLGQDQVAGGKVEGGRAAAVGQPGAGVRPVQAASDHQMEHQPQLAREADRDARAQSAQALDAPTRGAADRRLYAAQQEGVSDAQVLQGLTDHARLQRLDIDRDVRQLGHGGAKLGMSQATGSRSTGYGWTPVARSENTMSTGLARRSKLVITIITPVSLLAS
jgi:hypothetical protein